MNTHRWLHHFQHNAARPEGIDWNGACRMPAGPARALLADSLAIFQLGETGDGSTLKRWAAAAEARGDVPAGYAAAAAAFIAEENRHAGLLSRMVLHLGGTLKRRQWSAWLFSRIRKVVPRLEFELQVLLSAELVARAYYGLLASHVVEPAVRAGCASLNRDEVAHIAFHVDLFRGRLAEWLPIEAGLWRAQFQVLFLIAERIVWWDHGRALRAQGISRDSFRRQARHVCGDFLRRLDPAGRPEPASAQAALEA